MRWLAANLTPTGVWLFGSVVRLAGLTPCELPPPHRWSTSPNRAKFFSPHPASWGGAWHTNTLLVGSLQSWLRTWSVTADLWAYEVGTLATLRAHREELIEPKIAEHEGRIVKLTGDGARIAAARVNLLT